MILRADLIEEGKKIWQYNPHIGLILSGYDLTKENVYLFARLIRHYKLKTIHAYPSLFYRFSKLLEDAGGDTKGLFDFIWLSSEMLHPNQRTYLEKCYGKNIYIHYGQSEQVVYASPCKGSNNYHIYPQYGFTEILDEDDKEVAQNEAGQIIGTSFLNWVTPLIRYKTGDIAIKGNSFCKFCNRAYLTMKEIQGREQDFIVDKENTKITVVALNMHDDIFDDLLEFQFEQKEAGIIIFNYIPRKGTLNKAEADELVKRLKDKLRNFDILLNQVERFDFTVSGKKKMTIQHLSL